MSHLLHLTDLHLFAERDREHHGINTWQSLSRVLDAALAERTPAAILLSGDLSQDESAESYQHLRERLASMPAPVICLPGNHDQIALLHSQLASDQVQVLGELGVGDWRLLAIDCSVPGEVFGRLGDERLAALNDALSQAPDTLSMIALHHPPVACGSAWLDATRLRDADALFAVLDAHPQVRVALCGHIHQAMDQEVALASHTLRVLTTPATCRQFAVRHDDFALGDEAPGWRWITLEGATLDTEVRRLAA